VTLDYEAETDYLLVECERLYAARLSIPAWRFIKRWRADNAWLSAVAVLQAREQARAKLRQRERERLR
jgi:hypothetical protein